MKCALIIIIFFFSADAKKAAENCGDIRKYLGFKGKGNTCGGSASGSSQKSPQTSLASGKVVHGKNSSKENNPSLVRQKSNGISSSSSARGSMGRGGSQSNIRGFSGAATGAVKQVDVKNASKANVHGFGNGSPSRKKPRFGSGEAGTGKSGRPSGSFGSGTSLAVGSGSKTVTVKGNKSASKSDTQSDNGQREGSAISTRPSFQGQGYSLGGLSTGVSRLLSLGSSTQSPNHRETSDERTSEHSSDEEPERNEGKHRNSKNENSWISRSPTKGKSPVKGKPVMYQKSMDSFTSSASPAKSDQGSIRTTQCPMCDKTVPWRTMNWHLTGCVGKLEDECEWDVKPEKKEEVKRSPSGDDADNVVILSDDEDDVNYCAGASGVTKNSSGLENLNASHEEDMYPCPVCNDLFTQISINPHLDTHF